MIPALSRAAAALLLVGASAACDSSTTPSLDGEDPIGALTVAAVDEWGFAALGDPANEVQVAERAQSADWHLGFFATSVMLNGGDAGPGGVEGVCVCQNEGLSDAQVMGLDEASGLEDFEDVTIADVPADEDAWESDELVPAVDGWWSYDMTTHQVSADPAAVFKVRTADGASFAKLHVTHLEGATQQHAGTVTLEFAVQPGAGQPFSATQSLEVDVSGGPVAVDLESGATVAVGSAGWDLELSGYVIRVNAGVSGDADAGAASAEAAFDDVADAGDLPSRVYVGDVFGGVFAPDDTARRWYRYNLEGNHQIWPTQNVYLVRVADAVYKVQLTGYYDPDTGDARHITFRYQRLES